MQEKFIKFEKKKLKQKSMSKITTKEIWKGFVFFFINIL